MEQLKKYKLVQDDTVQAFTGATLYRVQALCDFYDVHAGDLGGYVQSEANLVHSGDAWVSGDAQVSGNAQVHGGAQVRFGVVTLMPLVLTGGRYVCTVIPGIGACIGCQDFIPKHLTSGQVLSAECCERGYDVATEEIELVLALWRVAEVTYANS